MNNVWKKTYFVIITLLISSIIVVSYNKTAFQKKSSRKKTATYTLKDIKKIFNNADSAQINLDGESFVFSDGEQIGRVLNTSPFGDRYIAYGGKLPFIIGINNSDKIEGISLLRNFETPGYIRRLDRRKFFDSWNGIPFQEVLTMEVEAISGATLTTDAVIKSFKKRIAVYTEEEYNGGKFDWNKFFKYILSFLTILFAVLSFLYTKQLKKFRVLLLLMCIAVFGFWQGNFISLQSTFNYLANGVKIPAQTISLSILLIALVFPLFFSKSFYCHFVCPYGAAQELCGKVKKKKLKLPKIIKPIMKYSREIFFSIIIILLLFQVSIDLTELEPFAAFKYNLASTWTIILGIGFLIISVFIPKAWCNYFCPTGLILEFFRKPVKSTKARWFSYYHLILIITLLIILIVVAKDNYLI